MLGARNAGIGNPEYERGQYRTREEIEALLATIFSAEELAAIGKTDFSKLPIGAKSLSEMVNEDREDRF